MSRGWSLRRLRHRRRPLQQQNDSDNQSRQRRNANDAVKFHAGSLAVSPDAQAQHHRIQDRGRESDYFRACAGPGRGLP